MGRPPNILRMTSSALLVFRARFAGEIEVRRKVDHRGNAATVALANFLQALPDVRVRGEIDLLKASTVGQLFGGTKIEPDGYRGSCEFFASSAGRSCPR
jgi:hypothetical protein